MNKPARRALSSPVRLSLPWRDPVAAFAPFEGEDGALFLHDGRSGRARIFVSPDRIVRGRGAPDFNALARALRRRDDAGGIWAGLFAYDLSSAFERLPELPGQGESLVWGHYPAWAEFDAGARSLVVCAPDEARAAGLADRLGTGALAPAAAGRAENWTAHWDRAAYLAAAAKARDYVHAGDVFQVNLSQRFNCTLGPADTPWDVFRRLGQGSPAPHAAYFRIAADRVVMTNSPERFIALRDGMVEACPIKGTRRRGEDAASDEALKRDLLASAKDRAENLMIVDLMRNDLARVCVPGSVNVPALFEVESYANVHHLVSRVHGRLATGRDEVDLIAASFPPGSITGAPKVRAMEIISELEGEARGAYCGALGWIEPGGSLDLNVMIRTVTLHRHRGRWQAELRSGGGIVADSDPVDEYEETLTKASALRQALGAA